METIKRIYIVLVRRLPLRIVALVALGLLLGLSLIRGCRTSAGTNNNQEPLGNSESLRVAITPERRLVVTTDSGDSTTLYVPQDGAAQIIVRSEGQVEVDVKAAGLSFKPGIYVVVTDRLRLGLDVQLAYWNRLELHSGVAFPMGTFNAEHIVGTVGVGYRLDQLGLRNTTVQAVITTDRRIGGALSVRF